MQRGFRWLGLVALAAGMLGAESAWASHTPCHTGSTSAAVAQYVEQIPTSCGSKATGSGGRRVAPLAAVIERQLKREGGRDAALLKEVATNSAYGAPLRRLKSKKGREQLERAAREDPTVGKALSEAVSVVGTGSDDRLIGLALVLLAITALAAGTAAYRRRVARAPGR